MVCDEGTNGKASTGVCSKGIYYPGGVDPYPAAGYYFPGTGFVAPLQCPPGYYTNETAQQSVNYVKKVHIIIYKHK